MRDLAYRLKVFRQIGLAKPQLPHRVAIAGLHLLTWGPGFPAAVAAAAARFPRQTAIIDDLGEMTWSEVRDQVNQLTRGLKDRGLEPGDSVALLARNHRYIVLSMIAIMQAGARVLLLNTMASPSQLNELANREGAKFIILDEEFLSVAEKVDRDQLLLAWKEEEEQDIPSVADILEGHSTKQPAKPDQPGTVIIFTSGTTGLPKGAQRSEPEGLDPLVAFFGAIPYHGNSTIVLAAPLFHSWGLINFSFGLSTVPTYVMRRRFNADQVLKDIEEHRAEALVVVPLMMQRLVDSDQAGKADVSSLRITAVSGSALAGELATTYMDTFTDSVYNFYGATETGWVTVASPEDLRPLPAFHRRDPRPEPVPQGLVPVECGRRAGVSGVRADARAAAHPQRPRERRLR